eukprot:scaffold34278_cov129-Isochrysis_galbana.AAC.4
MIYGPNAAAAAATAYKRQEMCKPEIIGRAPGEEVKGRGEKGGDASPPEDKTRDEKTGSNTRKKTRNRRGARH